MWRKSLDSSEENDRDLLPPTIIRHSSHKIHWRTSFTVAARTQVLEEKEKQLNEENRLDAPEFRAVIRDLNEQLEEKDKQLEEEK